MNPSGRPKHMGQIRPIVLQASIPASLRTETADFLRGYIGQFLRENLTPDLASERRKKIGASLVSFRPLTTDTPAILRSIRITASMDADLAEYAGIMQLRKRDVVYQSMVMGVLGRPRRLDLETDFVIVRRGGRSLRLLEDRRMLSLRREST